MDNQVKANNHEAPSIAASEVQSDPGEVRTCHNYWCNYKTNQALTRCPKCGRPLYTTHTFRLLGLALVFLGGLLAIGAVSLMILVAPRLPDVRGGMGGRLFVLCVFGLLLAVGLTFMTAGFWQVIFGRRSQWLVTIAITLLITLALIAAIGRAIL